MLGGWNPSRSCRRKDVTSVSHDSDSPSIADQARLVRLCREVWDEHTREECGKILIAYALCLEHGPTITIEPSPGLRPGGAPTSHRITVFDRLDEAVHTLDTFIDGPHNPHPLLPV